MLLNKHSSFRCQTYSRELDSLSRHHTYRACTIQAATITIQIRLFAPLNGSSTLLGTVARGGSTAFEGSVTTERLAGCNPTAAVAPDEVE